MPTALTRFEPEGFDLEGYWDPVTSSIDWCERNYVVSHYIAEFWNCTSSLLISLVGIWGVWTGVKYKLRTEQTLYSFMVVIIGLGSTWFHGTLSFNGQLADEIPMMWAMMVWAYLLKFLDAKHDSSDADPEEHARFIARKKKIALSLLVYVSVVSVVHTIHAFTVLFQVHFVFLVFSGFYLINHLCTIYDKFDDIHILRRYYFGTYLFAGTIWIIDQFFCIHLHDLPFGIPNPQLHGWWHFLVAWDVYLSMVLSRAMRYSFMSHNQPMITWHLWVIPVLKGQGSLEKAN